MNIHEAITEFERVLPGWWYSVASCSVSRDASCGPDRNGPDAALLDHRFFDNGFHADLTGAATTVDALLHVMRQALNAKAMAARGLIPNVDQNGDFVPAPQP